jgi:hypothetical protein
MTLYREFRGADPDRIPLLRARGLWVEPEPTPEELEARAEAEAAKAAALEQYPEIPDDDLNIENQ